MKITRHIVDEIPKVYSLAWLPDEKKDKITLPAFAAGSEIKGSLRQFSPPDHKPRLLAEKPGGFISLCPLKISKRRYLIASTRFLPVFDAADCRIVLYPLDVSTRPEPVEVMALPYTHRVAIVYIEGQPVFFGSTLCSKKDFIEDWNHPGGIYMSQIPSNPESPWSVKKDC